MHPDTQVPLLQYSPTLHDVVQLPQYELLVCRLTQEVSQQLSGALQSGPEPPHRHTPLVQISLVSQLVSQSPQ